MFTIIQWMKHTSRIRGSISILLLGLCLGGFHPAMAADSDTPLWKNRLEISPITTQTQARRVSRTTSPDMARIDLTFNNIALNVVVSTLANAMKKTIILGSENNQQVNAVFKDIPADEALRSLAQAQKLYIVEQGDSILLLTRQEYLNNYAKMEIVSLKHANPSALVSLLSQSGGGGGAAGAASQNSKGDLLVASADARTRTLVLKGDPEQVSEFREACLRLDRSMTSAVLPVHYASVTAVAKAISDSLGVAKESIGIVITDERSNQLIIHETPENIELCRDIIQSIDIPVETRVFSTGNIDPKKIADQIKKGELGGTEKGDKSFKSSVSADATVQVVEGSNQIIVTDTPERLAILDKIMNEMNGNIETQIIQPINSTPDQLAVVVKNALPDLVVTNDSRSGSMIMTGHRERIDQAMDLITTVDAEDNIQVEIESKIMLVSTDKLKQIGMRIFGQDLDGLNETLANVLVNPNFPADSSKKNGQPMGNPPDSPLKNPIKSTSNYLEVLQPNLQVQAVVRALESDGDTKILCSPRLRMLTGQEAAFFSGSKEPYKTTTLQNDQSVENVKFEDVGVKFTVTPNVSPSGHIMLAVNTEFSTLRALRDGVPVIDTRTAQSVVQANNLETILLGGLITQEDTHQSGGIPVLRSIPLVGKVFGDKRASSLEREMIIVITPTIVTRDMSAKSSLNSIKQKYSGIRKQFSDEKIAPEQKNELPETKNNTSNPYRMNSVTSGSLTSFRTITYRANKPVKKDVPEVENEMPDLYSMDSVTSDSLIHIRP